MAVAAAVGIVAINLVIAHFKKRQIQGISHTLLGGRRAVHRSDSDI
jgi:hypothetical protein